MDDEKKEQMARRAPMDVPDPEIGRGVYSNQSIVRHSNWEFIFDFGLMTPELRRPELVSRVTLSPQHAKSFMLALQKNVEGFEQKFGTVNVVTPGPDGMMKH